MTQKTFDRKPDGTPVKMPGWFSWRHRTREAHDAAREHYKAVHGREARRRKAATRAASDEHAAESAVGSEYAGGAR